MTLLVPIMLFGWIPLSVFFFSSLKPRHAVLAIVIGGTLFLPMTGYSFTGLPDYTKYAAISLGLVLGGRLSGKRWLEDFSWKIYDVPMLLWCFSPLATSLSNGLGYYDGISGIFNQVLVWGVPYLAGRIYFGSVDSLRDLCLGIIVGGILYMPLCLFEIRMSPQLSNMLYGFFPHSWSQHIRYGGFRPIVFMQHGLMVSLWMAVSTTVAFWFWRAGEIRSIKGLPFAPIVLLMLLTTILCKSANGWVAVSIGMGFYYLYCRLNIRFPLYLFMLMIPVYTCLRALNILPVQDVVDVFRGFFDPERVSSLDIRLRQEDMFCMKALQHPLFGWGGYGRGWPVDPETGKKMIRMVDALWLIIFSGKGFLGLGAWMAMMLVGPWKTLVAVGKNIKKQDQRVIEPIVLTLSVTLFMLDSLANGMVNQIYILISGALVSYVLVHGKARAPLQV